MSNILISVVVPTYNRSKLLYGALQSLIQQDTAGAFKYEVIVVDNASTDNTKLLVDEFAKIKSLVPIRYIFEKKEGQANALNSGVKASRGKFIAFFDDDQIAERNWLRELYNVSLKTGAQCVGGAVHLDLVEKEKAELGSITRKNLREIKYYETTQKYKGKRYQLPSSGNMLIAKSVFDKIGYFDGSMLNGAFDTDLCIRARAEGFDLWFAPKAIVRHRIIKNRLTHEYLRWNELKTGATIAYLDHKYLGLGKVLFICIARIGQAILINLPYLLIGYLKRDVAEIEGRKNLLARAEGYARKTLFYYAPNVFSQSKFFSYIEQRKGISIGKNL